jgi:hypothetical protein
LVIAHPPYCIDVRGIDLPLLGAVVKTSSNPLSRKIHPSLALAGAGVRCDGGLKIGGLRQARANHGPQALTPAGGKQARRRRYKEKSPAP